MRRIIKVKMDMSEGLYNKIDKIRKSFNEVNGTNMTLIQAGEFFARSVKSPKIPNLLEKPKKRRYKK